MKSIRERVMSQGEELEEHNPNLYDNEYGSQYKYPNFSAPTSYMDPVKGQIKITFTIENKEIGKIADNCSESFDWDKANTKATEIAADRIKELLGDYESKYKISIEINSAFEEFEAEITLIPIKKKKHA